jgi:hypothetical protein
VTKQVSGIAIFRCRVGDGGEIAHSPPGNCGKLFELKLGKPHFVLLESGKYVKLPWALIAVAPRKSQYVSAQAFLPSEGLRVPGKKMIFAFGCLALFEHSSNEQAFMFRLS